MKTSLPLSRRMLSPTDTVWIWKMAAAKILLRTFTTQSVVNNAVVFIGSCSASNTTYTKATAVVNMSAVFLFLSLCAESALRTTTLSLSRYDELELLNKK